jgi:hypothetical protein
VRRQQDTSSSYCRLNASLTSPNAKVPKTHTGHHIATSRHQRPSRHLSCRRQRCWHPRYMARPAPPHRDQGWPHRNAEPKRTMKWMKRRTRHQRTTRSGLKLPSNSSLACLRRSHQTVVIERPVNLSTYHIQRKEHVRSIPASSMAATPPTTPPTIAPEITSACDRVYTET